MSDYEDEDEDDEEADYITELLDMFGIESEVYYIDPVAVFGVDYASQPDDETPDAKFWREVAEDYERENMAHLRFQNLLLISLWQTGGFKVLSLKGLLN